MSRIVSSCLPPLYPALRPSSPHPCIFLLGLFAPTSLRTDCSIDLCPQALPFAPGISVSRRLQPNTTYSTVSFWPHMHRKVSSALITCRYNLSLHLPVLIWAKTAALMRVRRWCFCIFLRGGVCPSPGCVFPFLPDAFCWLCLPS